MKPYYQDSAVTIYHGNCREIIFDLPWITLLLTDPPYPNGEGHFDDSVHVAREVIKSYQGVTSMMIFWSEMEIPVCGLPHVATHIWHRTNVNGKIYEPCYEFNSNGLKRRSDVIRGAAIFEGAGAGCCEYLGHPTQKPTHVIRWLIELSRTSGTILDPFMGSGTTLRAAKDLGRKAIGIEIEEKYCEIAARRMEQEVLPLNDASNLRNEVADTASPLHLKWKHLNMMNQ